MWLMSQRQQPNVSDETSEYEETQHELRPAYTAEYSTIHSPLASTPSTVRSVSGEQVDWDSASANMTSIMGFLTDKQKLTRDRHNMNLDLFGNYLIENQERGTQARSARTAYKEPKFDDHQAMPAIQEFDSRAIQSRA